VNSFQSKLIAFLFLPALAIGATDHGEWTLSRSTKPGAAVLSFQSAGDDGHRFNSSSDWKISELQGLDWSTTGKHDVSFKIVRDAGTIEGDGFLNGQEGAGLFRFRPNSEYKREMAALGYPGVTEENQFAFALHNVSLQFARDIKAAGVRNSDTEKLLAFRIHGVSPEFVRELNAAGIGTTESDKLIAFRIHGVSAEYVKALQQLGYSHPDSDKLIALRIHGVTPEYIESLRSHGMQNLTLDQLVSLRIHGIN